VRFPTENGPHEFTSVEVAIEHSSRDPLGSIESGNITLTGRVRSANIGAIARFSRDISQRTKSDIVDENLKVVGRANLDEPWKVPEKDVFCLLIQKHWSDRNRYQTGPDSLLLEKATDQNVFRRIGVCDIHDGREGDLREYPCTSAFYEAPIVEITLV
jgi:hypothetical protein